MFVAISIVVAALHVYAAVYVIEVMRESRHITRSVWWAGVAVSALNFLAAGVWLIDLVV